VSEISNSAVPVHCFGFSVRPKSLNIAF
jgi:hypothetical protein